MSISIASAQSQRSYVYDATAYDLEGGGLSSERYVSKGRILGSTPILDMSSIGSIGWWVSLWPTSLQM